MESICWSVWCVCTFCLWLTAAAFFSRLVVSVKASTLRCRRFVLDSWFCSIQVQAPILDVLVDPLCCLQEGLLHILSSGEEAVGQNAQYLIYLQIRYFTRKNSLKALRWNSSTTKVNTKTIKAHLHALLWSTLWFLNIHIQPTMRFMSVMLHLRLGAGFEKQQTWSTGSRNQRSVSLCPVPCCSACIWAFWGSSRNLTVLLGKLFGLLVRHVSLSL